MDKDKLEKVIAPLLEQEGMELVDLVVNAHGHKATLQFFIDRKEGGINLDDCQRLSDRISGVLEMENAVEGAYVLEISSPGINRVLKTPEHFKRFVGQRARIMLKNPVEKRAMFTGIISAADDAAITLADGTHSFVFKYQDIKQARLDPVLEF